METLRILVPRFMRKHVWRKSYNHSASKKPVSAAAPQQPEEVHTLVAAMADLLQVCGQMIVRLDASGDAHDLQ